MQWSQRAEAAVSKVPFFVRRRVRARVESEAAAAGRSRVRLADVKTTQARFLNKMEKEVKGYQLGTCFGAGGCPHRAMESQALVERIKAVMEAADLLRFLRQRVVGTLRFHHEFRISIADCPNACSQVQIKDVGIVGACTPAVGDAPCSGCGACDQACKEEAISLAADGTIAGIDGTRCVHCGACVNACPTGTLTAGRRGYRVMIGGKLGRHPRLAHELPGIHDADTVIDMLEAFLSFYKARSTHGQRFAQLLTEEDIQAFARRWNY